MSRIVLAMLDGEHWSEVEGGLTRAHHGVVLAFLALFLLAALFVGSQLI